MYRWLYIAGCILLLIPCETRGQKSDPVADSLKLDEVVVTHSKVPITLRNTVKPMEVITREDIASSGTSDIAQLLHERSGVIVNGAYSNPAKDKALYLQGATSAYTLILIDGQPIVDPSGIGGALDIRLLDLRQVERIEILKGSQSALYGTDAIAGVINIVTRRETISGNRTDANLTYGAYHTLEGDIATWHKAGRSDVGLAVGFRRSEGISEALAPIPPADRDGMHTINLQGHFGTPVADSIRLQAQFRFAQFDGDYDDGAFADADNSFKYQMYDPEVRLEVRKQRLHLDLAYDATVTERVFKSSFGTDQYLGRFHNLEAFAAYRLLSRLRIAGGMSYQSHRMLDEAAVVPNPKTGIASPFASIVWEDPRFVLLETSFRHSNHEAYGNHSTFSVSAGRWIGQNLKMFAGYATGFRAPTLSMLYGRFGANPDLLPESSATIEGGLEYWSRNGRLQARLNAFHREVDDIIIYTTGFVNRNTQEDMGVDLHCLWKPTQFLQLNGRYGFLDGTLTSVDDTGTEVQTDGLIRQPRHRFSVSLDVKATPGLRFSLQAERQGERRDLFFNPETFQTQEVTLTPYTLVHLTGEYRLTNEDIGFTIRIINLTDTKFTEVYGFRTQGISAYAGVRLGFGS